MYKGFKNYSMPELDKDKIIVGGNVEEFLRQ
jgi:hypothetical protein